jgi:hypothetical protein
MVNVIYKLLTTLLQIDVEELLGVGILVVSVILELHALSLHMLLSAVGLSVAQSVFYTYI